MKLNYIHETKAKILKLFTDTALLYINYLELKHLHQLHLKKVFFLQMPTIQYLKDICLDTYLSFVERSQYQC